MKVYVTTEEAAHDVGVITNEEFAIFQNTGYIGLYGDLSGDNTHKQKNLPSVVKSLIS